MSDINAVRERLAAISGIAGARVSAESDDVRALLADHARLQASHDRLEAALADLRSLMHEVVPALDHTQEHVTLSADVKRSVDQADAAMAVQS